jgi:cytochrome b pre-mRNA-processing protein 3
MFYNELGVADTLDGRFDVIVLHLFIATRRLQKDSPEMLRAIWEVFFSDMDRSLREMGASDTGIGKRIKKMVQAFYGRIDTYDQTYGTDEFAESLKRNLYRGAEVSEAQLAKITNYIKTSIEYLETQSTASILLGELKFK